MRTVTIKYNPYKINTEILIDGVKPKRNSSLNVGKRRLQEWIDNLPHTLYEEFLDKEYSIVYTGTADDFCDVKEAFDRTDFSVTYDTTFTPPVEKVENDIHDIFSDIQNGPIDELRDPQILKAFNKAENQEFEVNVVATMSAGKSTLINALLSNQLMPAKKEATTATIVRIKDSDSEVFSAKAYDEEGNLVIEYPDVQIQQMREMNDNKSISTICVTGKIPFVKSGKNTSNRVRLVLVDTPGPNNSNDANHKITTYNMLKNSDKSLVLYVVNSDQFGINDDALFLDDVCKEMAKCGKQSKDRFIFAVNKLDETNPEEYDSDNCIADNLSKVKTYIEKRDVSDPNIFPVSALVALSSRRNQAADNPFAKWPKFVQQYKALDIFNFEQYYAYSHLPTNVKEAIDSSLKNCSIQEEVDIHSGIKSIEYAICLYIDKYARPTKVYDLTQSFKERLVQVQAVDKLTLSLANSREDKDAVIKEISKLNDKISKANDAKIFSSTLDDIYHTSSSDITKDVDAIVDPLKGKINRAIASDNKVPKNEALKKCQKLQSDCSSLSSQLISDVNSLLNERFKKVISEAIEKYKSYLTDLNIDCGDVLKINPVDLVAGEFESMTDLIKENTTKEHHQHTETKTETVFEASNRHWYNLWRLGFGHGDRYVERTKEVIVHTTEEYVDMRTVTEEYLEPYWENIQTNRDRAIEYMDNEIKRLIGNIKSQAKKIDDVLSRKLKDLEGAQSKEKNLEELIRTKEANLNWLSSIQKRVDNLIEF